MKTAVSIPDNVYLAAEEAARSLAISRSEFYTKALANYLAEQRNAEITAQLNEVYAASSSQLDEVLGEMMIQSLGDEQW